MDISKIVIILFEIDFLLLNIQKQFAKYDINLLLGTHFAEETEPPKKLSECAKNVQINL